MSVLVLFPDAKADQSTFWVLFLIYEMVDGLLDDWVPDGLVHLLVPIYDPLDCFLFVTQLFHLPMSADDDL